MLKYSFHPTAEKELSRLPIRIQEQVIAKLKEVCQLNHPLQHRNVIKLGTRKDGDFRMRVGNYRVKFILENSTIKITHIQHRQVGY